MTIDRAFYEHIRDNLGISTVVKYGTAENIQPPYCVMIKVSDQERPEVLCQKQGEAGKALFQFSGYMGGKGSSAANGPLTLEFLNGLKEIIKNVRGVIGTAPDRFRIDTNITSGARLIEGQDLQTWGAIFETEIWWEKI